MRHLKRIAAWGGNVRIDWSSLWRKEDWWAVWLGFIILGLASGRVVTWIPNIGKWTTDLSAAIIVGDIPYFVLLGIGILVLTSAAILGMKENVKRYWAGFPIVFLFSFLAFLLASQKQIKDQWGLEYAIWALVIGLLISNTVGTPRWLKPAVKTEMFIKIGLVLLGAEILFQKILTGGMFGMIQALLVVLLIWYLCYLLAVKVGLTKSFASILATGVSICGVSAAIAAGGAVKGDPKEISYTVSLVLLVAMPMLVFLPFIAKAIGLPDAVAGAWIGGTIDTTPAVVAAGALYSRTSMDVAAIVKMSQNVLIGVAAFVMALFWVFRVERRAGEKPSAMEIWYKFPKFILGFIVASLVFSLLLVPILGAEPVDVTLGVTKGLRGWFFALAFVCIGLETKFTELAKMGRGKPFAVFLVAQVCNILLTYFIAWALFGGIFFPPPI